jgi:hypothetical protein
MTTPQNYDQFIPVYEAIPEEWEEAREQLVERMRFIGNTVNNRQTSMYTNTEVLAGQKFDSATQEPRDAFRKTFLIKALPNAGVLNIPHGIKFDANFTLTDLYLSATDPVNFLAFSVKTLGSPVSISMDATNIIITTTGNYTAYTKNVVVVEYLLTP